MPLRHVGDFVRQDPRHLGFVVDSLDHAYHDLRQASELVSDFTLLERQEPVAQKQERGHKSP